MHCWSIGHIDCLGQLDIVLQSVNKVNNCVNKVNNCVQLRTTSFHLGRNLWSPGGESAGSQSANTFGQLWT